MNKDSVRAYAAAYTEIEILPRSEDGDDPGIVLTEGDESMLFSGTRKELVDFASRLRLALVDAFNLTPPNPLEGFDKLRGGDNYEAPITRTVQINLDDWVLGAALIDFALDGDVLYAEEADDQTIADKLHLAAEDMQLDGLIAYAMDFVVGTDLDEWHAVWANRVPNIEDVAELEVRMLRGVGGFYVERIPDSSNTARPLDWAIVDSSVDGAIVERFGSEQDAYAALPGVAAQKGN